MRSVPFGPFAHLVPPSFVEDRLQLLQMIRLEMKRRAGERPLAVLVDDGHRLEEGSLALLELLATTGDAFLILTMRTTDPAPDAWRALTSNGPFNHMVLCGLEDEAVEEILGEALGDTSPEARAALVRLAGGSPLLLKELLFHGKQAGTLSQLDGNWRITGEFGAEPGLIDLTEARISALSDEALQLFRELAVGSPLPRDVVAELDANDRLAELHRAELAVRRGDSVALAHPLYGEVVRSNLGSERLRKVKRRLAHALLHSEQRTPAIELQAATLCLQAGSCPPDLAISGATHALAAFDGELAERFAEEAAKHDDSWLPHMLRGRALFIQQRPAEAESAFALAEVPPEQPDAAAQVTWARAMNLAFGLGELQGAKDVLAAAAESLPEPHSTALHADGALINALLGDFDSVMRIGKPLLDKEGVPPLIRLKVHVSYTLAQAMRCRLSGFEDCIGEALVLSEAHRAELPMAPAQIGINQVFGLTALGRIDRALQAVAAGHERALADGNLVTLWGGGHGEVLTQAGFLRGAVDLLRENQRQMGDLDPFRTNPMFLGVEAAARAVLGETGEAKEILERAQKAALGPDPRYQARFGRARGWIAFHTGDPEEAVAILVTTGESSVQATHVLWGCEVLHDAVRLGYPERVAAQLGAAASETVGAEYVGAMAAHANALELGDAQAVESAAKRFRKCGARLLAAEAMGQAAALFHRDGQTVESHRATTHSMIWQRECGNPSTPPLAMRPPSLSAREYEIADLVARERLTSPQVASQLFLSARTVDNHLRSVYRKLDLRNRDALAEFWTGPAADPSFE
jgi:DNA-binding CsgD family transcriptional regulator